MANDLNHDSTRSKLFRELSSGSVAVVRLVSKRRISWFKFLLCSEADGILWRLVVLHLPPSLAFTQMSQSAVVETWRVPGHEAPIRRQ